MRAEEGDGRPRSSATVAIIGDGRVDDVEEMNGGSEAAEA
jgi:hypothetical protein